MIATTKRPYRNLIDEKAVRRQLWGIVVKFSNTHYDNNNHLPHYMSHCLNDLGLISEQDLAETIKTYDPKTSIFDELPSTILLDTMPVPEAKQLIEFLTSIMNSPHRVAMTKAYKAKRMSVGHA